MRVFVFLLFFLPQTVFADFHVSCCSRTPKYIIAASTLLGAAAGGAVGYAARNSCSNQCCTNKKRQDKHKKFAQEIDTPEFSEIVNELQLIAPEDNKEHGPLIQVTLYSPDQQIAEQVIMGRKSIPVLAALGGEGNPTKIGKWTVAFQLIEGNSARTDFGGIRVKNAEFRTAFINYPSVGEQQLLSFYYPISQ